MADGPGTCPNGHSLAENDRFCDQCGALSRCENGHVVREAGIRFCEVCGVALTSPSSKGGFGTIPKSLVLAAGGLFVAIVVVAAYFLAFAGNGDDPLSAAADDTPTSVSATATLAPEQTATLETSAADPTATETSTEPPRTNTPTPERPTPTATTSPATPTPVPPAATSVPPTPVPPVATATPTPVVSAGPCYQLNLSKKFYDDIEDRDVGLAADTPNSPGCLEGFYVEGQVLHVAVNPTVGDIHPVWGIAPDIPLACTHCEGTNFVMPAANVFLLVAYFAN